jgi:hypothetical protein
MTANDRQFPAFFATRRALRAAFALSCVAIAAAPMSGCAGGQRKAEVPVQKESPGDEIRRIATTWTNVDPAKGILSPPSPISVFHTSTRSVITLKSGQAHETLTIEEELELRTGATVRCSQRFEHPLGVRYGRKLGEAAVEITRPRLSAVRSCEGAHPEPEFRQPARVTRFVLRSDRLVAIDPATDGRTYLPEPN